MKFLSDPSNSTTKPWAHRGPGVQCAGRDGSIGSTPGVVTSQGTSLFGGRNHGIFRSKSEFRVEDLWKIDGNHVFFFWSDQIFDGILWIVFGAVCFNRF